MKIFQALLVGTLAAKGGKKKAEREAAKAAALAAQAEAERLSSTPELGPGTRFKWTTTVITLQKPGKSLLTMKE
ncbi:Oidioi.mRNA.OKI2018_I69.chr1.g861.t1.cds [Oikopleura dioica]|uniref:Oidioi.mRNA.OKI2018_I69.chr1.g861.t1.cds n=1 Tax=Oikopleura dioica TaxID=34765 RepID=A0ABN7SL76_OIKDI|nr:Oidioi.mRNA.OKI2018_I69.chr1.g861.t1.cds [Oikopleura dioica]